MHEGKGTIELDDTTAWSGRTEEFLAQLHRSSELLRSDRADEARRVLESAFESRSEDASGQATLALVYFKLGIYSRALAIYRRLVEEFPGESTLRLNLGLIYLKTGQTERAKRELEELVAMRPDYRKAQGYLGLAYQRLGNYALAKEAFEKAGANHLAEQMSSFTAPEASEPIPREDEAPAGGDLDLSYSEDGDTDEPDERGFPAELVKFIQALPFSSAAPLSLGDQGPKAREPVLLSEMTQKTRLPEPLTGQFLISEAGYLLMDIRTSGFTRLAGLHFLSAEKLSYQPARRRYRGQESQELFGDDKNPIFFIEGNGRLGFHPGRERFNALSLDGENAYLREEFFFAMDSGLGYENGRIPGGDSMLVHVRGRGSLVLLTPSEPRSLEVTPERGVVIPTENLVGWFGRLLPRPARSGPFNPSMKALEMTGEGVLLICFA